MKSMKFNEPDEKLFQLKEFLAQYPDAGAGANARKLALATIEQNIAWIQRNGDYVSQWLINNVN